MYGRRLLLSVALLVLPVVASAQVSYQVGYSGSWGAERIWICTLTCGPGVGSSHRDLMGWAGGIGFRFGSSRRLHLETGAWVSEKGWRVTTPTLRTVFVEVPLLVHVGHVPRRPGLGFTFTAGAALDLGLPGLQHSHAATILGAQLLARAPERSIWSLGVRYASGINKVYGFHVYALTVFLGVTPRG